MNRSTLALGLFFICDGFFGLALSISMRTLQAMGQPLSTNDFQFATGWGLFGSLICFLIGSISVAYAFPKKPD